MKRQKIHFTPIKGWMNDPNGLIFENGKYHIFYQHYPDDTKWGPMHWGHAVSEDLINWEHLPVALYPTEKEYIFSGSAIIDRENVSGLGMGKNPPMLLFYTSHNPDTGEQMQSMAYSLDYVNFKKYGGNPVIANSVDCEAYKKDFRDPKIFRNSVKGGFGMVLAVGEEIWFYNSKNLIDWEYAGAFYPKEYGYGGLCECPDMFPLVNDGMIRYILTVSMIFKKEGAGEEAHVMQYFVGSYDGNAFINEQTFDDTQLLDFGQDNYAMVSFADSPKPLMLGWGENWNKARKNSAQVFFGKLTLPREISLCKVKERYVIRQIPFLGGSKIQNLEQYSTLKTVDLKENHDIAVEELWEKKILLKQGEQIQLGALTISNEGKSLVINKRTIKRAMDKASLIHVICDNGYYELFADDGMIVYSSN